ncbi:MAG: hypothetical protein V2A67_03945 [Bacteroidota bacterium]
MKNLTFTILLVALLAGCKQEPATVCTITGKASNCDAAELYVHLDDVTDTIKLNDDGTFSKDFTVTRPIDGYLAGRDIDVNWFYLNLYMEPGKNLEINFDGTEIDSTVKFSGALCLPAQYLHEKSIVGSEQKKQIKKFYKSPYTPVDFKRVRDSINQVEFSFLNQFEANHSGFSKAFYQREKKVLEFSVYYDLVRYSNMISPDNKEKMKVPDNWYAFLDDAKFDDPALLEIESIKDFFIQYVGKLTLIRANIPSEKTYGNPDWIRDEFTFVKENSPIRSIITLSSIIILLNTWMVMEWERLGSKIWLQSTSLNQPMIRQERTYSSCATSGLRFHPVSRLRLSTSLIIKATMCR